MRSFGKNINNSLGGVFDATSRLVTRVGRDTISYVTLGGAVGIDYLYSGQINPLLLACAGIYEIRRAAHLRVRRASHPRRHPQRDRQLDECEPRFYRQPVDGSGLVVELSRSALPVLPLALDHRDDVPPRLRGRARCSRRLAAGDKQHE